MVTEQEERKTMEDYEMETRIQQREREIWTRMAERRADRTIRVAVQAMTNQPSTPKWMTQHSNSDSTTPWSRTTTTSHVSHNVTVMQPASALQKTKVELLHGLYRLVEERGKMLDRMLAGMGKLK
jgi:hypothetical protein